MFSSPLILGHRGASAVAPENTITAFARAMQEGADGIEFDVRLCRDLVPVVIHDDTLKRTGQIDRLVSSFTASELQEIDVGSWFNVSRPQLYDDLFKGEPLPLLSEVLEFFTNRLGVLYIEMKCEPQQGALLAEKVVSMVREYQFVDRVVVESFDLPSIGALKEVDASIRTAALFEPKLSHPISTLRRIKMIDQALQHQADEIALHHSLVGNAVIENARQRGLEVVVWTVDEPAWCVRAQRLGVKALITNTPARMTQNQAR